MLKKTIKDNKILVDNLPKNIVKGAVYSINQPNPNNFTHGFFKYPCKFIPEIPRWAMNAYLEGNGNLVLDPFGGSGTTVLEAIIRGQNGICTEIDKFAKKLIKVKTTKLSTEEINYIKNWLNNFVKNSDNYNSYKYEFVAPINNLSHWFTEENIHKLAVIKTLIEQVENESVKDFLLVCFGSIIRKCSNSDEVSPKPYVSTKYPKIPSDPYVIFKEIVLKYMDNIIKFSYLEGDGKAKLLDGDALKFESNELVDLAITSPPYINAFDYARTLRLENLWLALETEQTITKKKKLYVGTENIKTKMELENLEILDESDLLKDLYAQINIVDHKRALIVKKFFEDMKTNLITVNKNLKINARYCVVIGNSTIRNVVIPSWEIIAEIAKKVGYEVETYFSYVIQNHYLRIPRGKQGGKIKSDYVLVLKKISLPDKCNK